MKETQEVPPHQSVSKDRIVHTNSTEQMLAIDKQTATLGDHRRDHQPDHHARGQERDVFRGVLFPKSGADSAHNRDKNRQADRAPERTNNRAAISPFDFHKGDAAPQIITS